MKYIAQYLGRRAWSSQEYDTIEEAREAARALSIEHKDSSVGFAIFQKGTHCWCRVSGEPKWINGKECNERISLR